MMWGSNALFCGILVAGSLGCNRGDHWYDPGQSPSPGADGGGASSVSSTSPSGQDPYAPCTDPVRCCPPSEMVCTGNPDNGSAVCTCVGLWDCTPDLQKCQQDKQAPPGGGEWRCTWNEFTYTCVGDAPDRPPGGGGWACQFDDELKQWVCAKSPPNPTNNAQGGGLWQCHVDEALDKIVCDRKHQDAGPPPPPPLPPDAGPPPPPPPPKVEQNCADGIDNDSDHLVDCKDPDCPPCPHSCPPGTECCDGLDNDGDGKIDEGNVCQGVGEPCPPGAYQPCDCYCGVFRRCMADGRWGPCMVNDSCTVALVTSHSQCGSGQYCDFGECVGSGYLGGSCFHHGDCPQGQVCDVGVCIADSYTPCN